MKALLLGCGEMGAVAGEDLYRYGNFDEILVATRTPARAQGLLRGLQGRPTRVGFARVDAADEASLAAVFRGCAVAVNCVGPNFRYEERIARTAIRERVHLVDLNDEFEVTLRLLALDAEARRAGITLVMGLGASPGINNILVRSAANQLDEVEEIHTSWVMSAADPGGLALAAHLLYSLSARAVTGRDGRLVEVQSFVDGRERIRFPEPVGAMDVFHVGHPEPITLMRSFPAARVVDDKATFNPPLVNELIVRLGRLVREATGPVVVDGSPIDVMDFAASYLRAKCKSLPGVCADGALRVEVKGRKADRTRTVTFSSAGRLGTGTGIPASIGALMLAQGRIERRGVLPPEECIEPNEFLYELFNRRNAGKLNGWVEDTPRVLEPHMA